MDSLLSGDTPDFHICREIRMARLMKYVAAKGDFAAHDLERDHMPAREGDRVS